MEKDVAYTGATQSRGCPGESFAAVARLRYVASCCKIGVVLMANTTEQVLLRIAAV